MSEKQEPPKIEIEMISIDPNLPCAFDDCSKKATIAMAKPLKRRKLGPHTVKPWEILPVCDLHLKLTIRDFEVTQRMKEVEEEGKTQP